MIELINRYGIKIVKKGKDCCDFPELNKKKLIKFYWKVVHREVYQRLRLYLIVLW